MSHKRDKTEGGESQLERPVDSVLRQLARAVQFRDEETGEHVERMSRSCALIAAQLGWSQCHCVALRAASALHDVGKVGVPDHVLRKPGPLDNAERVLVERHPMIGHEILAGSGDEVVELAARVALTHHERVDGAGYPSHLRGSDIPLEGRIAAVADVFDALTNDRVYRSAFEPDQALETMRRERGTHFDPAVFVAFEHVLEEILETARRYPDAARPVPAKPPDKSHVAAPTVLIVEAHEAIAKGLALLLRREGLAVVGSASQLDQARALLRRRRPDVAIVDLDVVGASGFDLIPAAQAVDTRVLIYSCGSSAGFAGRARAAGAAGVASKASSARELLDAVHAVARGEWTLDPRLDERVVTARPVGGLTRREREVASLLAAGLTGEEIAIELFLSPETVRTHIRNAMQRIGAKTRAHLVTLAAERNEIDPQHRDTSDRSST